MFYTIDDVVRLARMFRGLKVDVSEELRGWRWSEYPLMYPYSFRLSVSDIANGFCESGRFVYVRYVLRARERAGLRVRRGLLVHRVFAEAIRAVKAAIYGGAVDGDEFRLRFMGEGERVREEVLREYGDVPGASAIFDRLWSHAADVYSSSLVRARSKSPYLSVDSLAHLVAPLTAEHPIDGSLIGLTGAVRVDALLYPNIMVEFKTRDFHPDYELGVAGYALAFESQYEVPVNFAVIAMVRLADDGSFRLYERVVRVDDNLRSRFIERRDQLARIVEDGLDPGPPARCHDDCPYRHVCRGEG